MRPLNRSYDDIIELPRPISPRRNRMSPLGRAAQFAPFAALTGFETEIDETARLNIHRCEKTGPYQEESEDFFIDVEPD